MYTVCMDTGSAKGAGRPVGIDQARPIVLYDGACPLCRREISHYRRLVGDRDIAWIDITRGAARIEALGIPVEQAMQRFHVRDRTGDWHTGAFAFAELWRHLPGYRLLAAVLRHSRVLPLIDRAYSRFAVWRIRNRCDKNRCGGAP